LNGIESTGRKKQGKLTLLKPKKYTRTSSNKILLDKGDFSEKSKNMRGDFHPPRNLPLVIEPILSSILTQRMRFSFRQQLPGPRVEASSTASPATAIIPIWTYERRTSLYPNFFV
jgi:hypothetical protein